MGTSEVLCETCSRGLPDERHDALPRESIVCAPAPSGSTAPLVEYFAASHDLWHYLGMTVSLAKSMDSTLEGMLAFLPEEDRVEVVNYSREVEHYRPVIFQILLNRSVDLFLTYVARVLAMVFEVKPEVMRSGAQVRLDDVLQHKTMGDLVRALADEQVARLAYKNIRELNGSIEQQLGVSLFEEAADVDKVVDLVEVRNLFVHNMGIVNRTFLRKAPSYRGAKLDEPVPLNDWVRLGHHYFLLDAAIKFDRKVRKKFAVPSYEGLHPKRRCHRPADPKADAAQPGSQQTALPPHSDGTSLAQ